MGKTIKIAVSLPQEILVAAEREGRTRGETRDEFIRHALETVLHPGHSSADAERYIEGYRQSPETDDDVARAHQASAAMLALDPWE